MTKKTVTPDPKEEIKARRQLKFEQRDREQQRQIYLALGGVFAIIVLVLVIGLVNEFFIKPTQPVAIVNEKEISSRDWQARVRFQRAQFISNIEEFYETTEGNVGLVQQLFGQQMNLLLDEEQLGSLVLNAMIDEQFIKDAAQARGITVSEEEIQKEIEAQYNYFDGGLPTPLPTATQTIVPTPSITPFPSPTISSTAGITQTVPTLTPIATPTLGPTATPLPTGTPVSAESFAEQFETNIDRLRRLGGSEEILRQVVEAQLYREKLQEALATEEEVATEEEQASFFILTFDNEEAATQALAEINAGTFLDLWNKTQSLPIDPTATSRTTARELLWRNREAIETLYGEEVTQAVFTLAPNTPSGLLAQYEDPTALPTPTPTPVSTLQATPVVTPTATPIPAPVVSNYHIVLVSGREMRPLTESQLQTAKQENLTQWLDAQQAANSQILDRWLGRVPRTPLLDPKYLVAPTPAPTQPIPTSLPVLPTIPAVTSTPTG